MKKRILYTILLGLINFGVFAQNVTIPDANFKAYLVGNTSINSNMDSEIQVSEAAAYTGWISCASLGISDMTGIEAFPLITKLYCQFNTFTTLDISQNTALTLIQCGSGNLNALTVSPNSALKNFNCTAGNLSALDVSQFPGLEILACAGNNLITLNVTQNTSLKNLYCKDNNLTTLDLSQNTVLEYLNCSENNFSSIDVSDNTALIQLNVGMNNLSSIDVSQNTALIGLTCFHNNIVTLDLSQNLALENLLCLDNDLYHLDLSNNTALTYLNCQSNNLTALNLKNISTTTLTAFVVSLNPNLTCIEVDDVPASNAAWTNKDAGASFGTDCNYVGVDELFLQSFTVSPNPTESYVTISNYDSKIESITILDCTGKRMHSYVPENEIIDLSRLQNGIYFVTLQLGKELFTQKIVKQ